MTIRVLVSLIGLVLTACGPVVPQARTRTVLGDPAWVHTIIIPKLFGYPARYRGEFVELEQCRSARKVAAEMFEKHRSNMEISPCTLGVATTEMPE